MEISIGVDSVDISRFEDKKNTERLMKNIFTKNEIEYCIKKANPAQHFAARFAGKEAVIKALSSAGINISMKEIEILNDLSGAPMVNIPGTKGNSCSIKLSLSHSKETAIAMALVTWEGKSRIV